ncbi:MAG: hypothetical protein GXY83_18605 [Rhodopirellula sp.]|nr:hypothetical protein [Rhodopirellula sp.]
MSAQAQPIPDGLWFDAIGLKTPKGNFGQSRTFLMDGTAMARLDPMPEACVQHGGY